MMWMVEISGKKVEVGLPDGVPQRGPFRIQLKGEEFTAYYDHNRHTLSLENQTKSAGLHRHFVLRRASVLRNEGEIERAVNIEFAGGGLPQTVSLRAVTRSFIPGIEVNAKLTEHKAQVVRSPMAGKVLKVFVKVGQNVTPGETLFIVEAMKMENKILSLIPGKITSIKVKEGAAVVVGQELARVE